jgi:hypothetical protein
MFYVFLAIITYMDKLVVEENVPKKIMKSKGWSFVKKMDVNQVIIILAGFVINVLLEVIIVQIARILHQ